MIEREIGLDSDPGLALREALVARRRASVRAARMSIAPAAPGPLSFMQEGIWFDEQVATGKTAYHLHISIRLRGRLDERALGESVASMVKRHAVLRTTFVVVDGAPRQVVSPTSQVAMVPIDARGWSEAVLESKVRALADAPFDLERGPLLRATLLRTDATEWQLRITVHHLVWDGWSYGIFVRELGTLYAALSKNEMPALSPLTVEYADYVAWQRATFGATTRSDALSFWLECLRGAPPSPVLPKHGPPASATDPTRVSHKLTIPSGLTDRMRALARHYDVSLFVLSLAAFDVVLSLSTGQEDVVLATPVGDRSLPGARKLIGLFVNTVLLRLDLRGDPTFAVAVARAKETALRAFLHAEVPFSVLVQELNPVRDTAQPTLAQIELTFDQPASNPSFAELVAEFVASSDPDPTYDLALRVIDRGSDGLVCAFLFRPEVYDLATVARLGEQLLLVLGASVADPDARIDRLPLAAQLPSVVPRKQAFPPSPALTSAAQTRTLFIWDFARASVRFARPTLLRLVGSVDVVALGHAVRELVHRHEALRTTFSLDDGRPHQRVRAEADPGVFEVVALDASALPTADVIATSVHTEVHTPFDIVTSLPLRVKLFAVAKEEHLLLLTTHQIVTDDASDAILVRELAALYTAFLEGSSPPAPGTVQVADHATWQDLPPVRALLDLQLSYWRAVLEGAPNLELPTDRQRPRRKRHAGAHVGFELGPSVVAKVRRRAEREGTSTLAVLLAAFDVLLSRLSGSEDIVVACPFLGRRPELAATVGAFENLLPIRTSLHDGPSFRELLRRVTASLLDASAHQDVPLARIIDALDPPRDLSRTPIFQAMLTLRPERPASAGWPAGLEVRQERCEVDAAFVDLGLELQEGPSRFLGRFELDTDLFDRSTVERWAASYAVLLEAALDTPDAPVISLPMTTAEEQRRVLSDWNATSQRFPDTTSFTSLFEAQVARTPENVAAQCGDDRATYAELSARADRASDLFRKQGLTHGAVVGLLATRSIDFLAAILGAWRIGVAYLPLDPKHPVQRIAAVLAQSKLGHVCCEEAFLAIVDDARALTRHPVAVSRLPVGPS